MSYSPTQESDTRMIKMKKSQISSELTKYNPNLTQFKKKKTLVWVANLLQYWQC